MSARDFLPVLWLGLLAPAHSQVIPILDCVDVPSGSSLMISHWGYFNTLTTPMTLPAGTVLNFFAPLPSNRFQPSVFQPGVHHYQFSLATAANADLTWLTNNQVAIARNDPALYCRNPNTRISMS